MRSTKSPLEVFEKGLPCAGHLGTPFKRLRSSSILWRYMHPMRTGVVNGVTKPARGPPIIHCMWEAHRLTKHLIICAFSFAITSYPCEHAVRLPRLTHANMLCGNFHHHDTIHSSWQHLSLSDRRKCISDKLCLWLQEARQEQHK